MSVTLHNVHFLFCLYTVAIHTALTIQVKLMAIVLSKEL